MLDAMGRIFFLSLELRDRGYVDDVKLHLRGASRDLPERVRIICHRRKQRRQE